MVMKLSTHSITFKCLKEVTGMRCGYSEEKSSERRGLQRKSIVQQLCSAQNENVALSLARSIVAKLKSKAAQVSGPKMH